MTSHGHSMTTAHILVLGDFDGPSYDGIDGDPTVAQMNSLDILINYLIFDYKNLYIKP
jgi:hypothetical protein